MPPQVSVVVPCRNEERHIGRVLAAIAAQTQVVSEVVVVDGASSDGTLAQVARFACQRPVPVIHVEHAPPEAIATALNRGIARAHGEVIVRMDAHAIPSNDYVERALRVLEDDRVGVVGGVWRIEPSSDTPTARAIAWAVAHPLAAGDAAYRVAQPGTGTFDVESVPFGCYRRQVWAEVGRYDEHLRVAEDYEFNHRVRARGFRVVLDTSLGSTYYARSTFGALGRQYFRYGWWKGEVFRRVPGAWRWRTLVPAAFVASLGVGAALAPLVGAVRLALLGLIGAYGLTAATVAVAASREAGGAVAWRLPLVFATVHLAQGTGLLLNLVARRWSRRLA